MFWYWIFQDMTPKKFWNEIVLNKKPKPLKNRYPYNRLHPQDIPKERPTVENMATVVIAKMDDIELARLAATDKEDLAVYHHTLGRQIRNHFHLWHYDFEPMIVNNVDVSPDHPDQISFRVMEEAWTIAQQLQK